MACNRKYILTIEFNEDLDVCDSVTEEYIYPDLSLMVDKMDLVDYFDDSAIELCKDCYEIGLS
jgi:hypothetical protein